MNASNTSLCRTACGICLFRRTAIPAPRFISWINGKPDFRSIEPDKLGKAVRLNLCWLCGQALGSRLAMVVGPMCIINRVSSEPPCHRECAEYAVVACPFLSDAIRRRNTRPFVPGGDRLDIEHSENVAGEAIGRNPGIAAIWITKPTKCSAWTPARPAICFGSASLKQCCFS